MRETACILNTGQNAWAFESVAKKLATATGLPVQERPAEKNYLLGCDDLPKPNSGHEYFVDLASIQMATDKRLIAEAFDRETVPCPRTLIFDTLHEAKSFASQHGTCKWCLKFPSSCGGAGHRLIDDVQTLPRDWPTPLILQEFIELKEPEVYRTYTVAGEIFGWIARRFPPERKRSPWVAHARGARYEVCGEMPRKARSVAAKALSATGLLNRFGCVDLIEDQAGRWLALEVGTDGWLNHVDRDLGDSKLEADITQKLADAITDFVDCH